ncbi:MAG: hypothetical protein ABFQ65_01195 [Nanoarchaeota archaeon]
MKNLVSRLKNNFFKKIVPIAVAFSTFSFNSLAYSKENLYNAYSQPKPDIVYENNIKKSKTEFLAYRKYDVSNGFLYDWETFEIGNLKRKQNGDVLIKNKNGEEVCISDFFNERDYENLLSKENLEEIISKLGTGEMLWEDIIFSEEDSMTFGMLKDSIEELFESLGGVAKITYGENFGNYKVGLDANADLELITTTTKSGDLLEFINREKVLAYVKGDINLELGFERSEIIPTGDMEWDNFFEAGGFVKTTWNYDFYKSFEKFSEIGYKNGALNSSLIKFGIQQQKWERERISYKSNFNLKFRLDLFAPFIFDELIEERLDIKEQGYSELGYGIFELNDFLLMAGINQNSVTRNEKSCKKIKNKFLDFEREIITDIYDCKENTSNDFKENVLYGGGFVMEFAQHLSFYLAGANNKNNNQFGVFANSQYFNGMLNNRDFEFSFTIFGNKSNPYYDYYYSRVKALVSPINIETKMSPSLLTGLFLGFEKKDFLEKQNIVLGFPSNYHLKFEKIKGEDSRGYSWDIGLNHFEMGFYYEDYFGPKMHGETNLIKISGNIDNVMNVAINSEIKVKTNYKNELELEGFGIYFSKYF